MAEEPIIFFAKTNFRNEEKNFGIKAVDRRRHMYVVGKTGMGKTTMIQNMAIQDIKNGHGLAVVDPHGEFAEELLDHVPAGRINDVIYFNPADLEWPIAFNAIEKVSLKDREIVVSGLMAIFKKIWPDVWSARMEYILNNTLWALIERPGTTLLGINRMLADKDYRDKIISSLTDPATKAYWLNEFNKYPDRFREEAVAPIQNKVGQFISSPLIRNIIGQTRSSIDMRQVMDGGKILILNLSKGKIGEEASRLLGALFITKLQLAAMSRVDVPESDRKDFYLYVDEFQNFATDSFANILSEARKYRLSLILAHQYIRQLITNESTKVKDAVFGNVGTMISFRVGAEDAEFLEKEFFPEFNAQDFVNLSFANIYIKLTIDGVTSRPFSALTLPPIPTLEKTEREKIMRVSRERYGRPRQEVEEKIARWSGVMGDDNLASVSLPENKLRRKSARPAAAGPVFTDKCWRCGVAVQLNFKPDGQRPIYCKDCLKGTQREQARAQQETGQNSWRLKTKAVSKKQPAEEEITLAQAVSVDRRQKKPKKEKPPVDLAALRQTLQEVLQSAKSTVPKEKKAKNSQKGELRAGEDVEI
ncbi:MAG: hypothetical protein COU85_01795 [Candidatus Portnoybacteria bacterium CG10_big_fil_rev_8_21_14_0_10_44_7]|uniref:Uncharacterized protein n=1 Tax=Candidatus Portnoybacteria bacterium CG10_big_fil_rev_8_21_14_0_10_44_7 TaxID=1974816 RepID=A0A2M8KIN0_9BACT|nr:MAG: hypothetical protein COU85_01795 [Candidatus Portnoybacteria bacterium CG10_big_fil_rev_8_21_14_0_10_44_7]